MISDEQVQAALKAYKSTRGPASDSMRNALEAAEIEDVERWLTTVPPQQEKLEAADWRAFRDVQLRCHELDPRVVPDLELPQGDYWPARNKDELARFKEWLASQDEPECEHVWRSSFGDTFCEKCNQDAPVEIASERCRTCKGSGTWADEGWSKPPQPCKACSGSGLAPIRKRKPTVPVQQDEPEGVCAFPNCSCTENRCPAKGERGPFCDHGFHPRLCGRCAPVPEAVTDEDEVQCQMCKTVQPRPDKECGHCGAGPKYLCPIHTRPAAVPVQQERSVRAPKTDDPHSLPRVDDLLDDIPVQQEPGRYSDRERVADYLASAQGVEFHDLNDDAQREWLMRASDALRAVWSIGRLVDADDGYEVMCEPVAAMVEDVRAALVPVQQDEPEDDHWHWLDDRTGRIYHEGDVFGVWSGRDVTLHRLRCTCDPVQQESDLRALRRREASFGTSRTDLPITPEPEDDDHVPSVGLRDRVAEVLADVFWDALPDGFAETKTLRLTNALDRILSVLHEAGTQDSCGGDGKLVARRVVAEGNEGEQ